MLLSLRREVDPSKVYRIEMVEEPDHFEADEGSYEVKRADKPDEIDYYDIISLHKELTNLWPEKAESIIDRIQNFRVVYIDLKFLEITS